MESPEVTEAAHIPHLDPNEQPKWLAKSPSFGNAPGYNGHLTEWAAI